jgi:hypothetical protein
MRAEKYSWDFEHGGKTIQTILRENGQGDLIIQQQHSDEELSRGLWFAQHAVRSFFVSVLLYVKQENIESILDDHGERLFTRIKKLPDIGGNFHDGVSIHDAKSDFDCYGGRPICNDPKEAQLIAQFGGDAGYMGLDGKILTLNHGATKRKFNDPLIIPPEQTEELIFGLVYAASHGMCRTFKSELVDRLNYFFTTFVHQ